VELTSKIHVRLTQCEKNRVTGEFVPVIKLVDTTVGRALLSEILPKGLVFSSRTSTKRSRRRRFRASSTPPSASAA